MGLEAEWPKGEGSGLLVREPGVWVQEELNRQEWGRGDEGTTAIPCNKELPHGTVAISTTCVPKVLSIASYITTYSHMGNEARLALRRNSPPITELTTRSQDWNPNLLTPDQASLSHSAAHPRL